MQGGSRKVGFMSTAHWRLDVNRGKTSNWLSHKDMDEPLQKLSGSNGQLPGPSQAAFQRIKLEIIS